MVQPRQRAQRGLVVRVELEHALVHGERVVGPLEVDLEHGGEALLDGDLVDVVAQHLGLLIEGAGERLPLLGRLEHARHQEQRPQIALLDAPHVDEGGRRLVRVGHALRPQPRRLLAQEAVQRAIGRVRRLLLVEAHQLGPLLGATVEPIEREEGEAMAGRQLVGALVEAHRLVAIAEAPLEQLGDLDEVIGAPLVVLDLLGFAQLHLRQLGPARAGAEERVERLQRRQVQRVDVERRRVGDLGGVEVAELGPLRLGDAEVQIGARHRVVRDHELAVVDVDELAPAPGRLEHRRQAAQRRRLRRRRLRRLVVGGERALGVVQLLPQEVASALAQPPHRLRVGDQRRLGQERARQLVPILVEQAERLQRQRRGDVARIVGERQLVRGARRGAQVEPHVLDDAGVVPHHAAVLHVDGGVGERDDDGEQVLPAAPDDVQLGERLDHRGRRRVELARLLERLQRGGAVAVVDHLERGDLDEQRHALARLADLVDLLARRLERLVEVARLPGAPPPDGRDPALARQPLGRAERRLRGVELAERRRQHRHGAEEQGPARRVALAQLLGVALERGQLRGPRLVGAAAGGCRQRDGSSSTAACRGSDCVISASRSMLVFSSSIGPALRGFGGGPAGGGFSGGGGGGDGGRTATDLIASR